MARVGHKEGCQCAVCKVMAAKELREGIQTPVIVKGITLGSLKIGERFMYQGYTHIRYGKDQKTGMIMTENIASREIVRLNEDIIVEA